MAHRSFRPLSDRVYLALILWFQPFVLVARNFLPLYPLLTLWDTVLRPQRMALFWLAGYVLIFAAYTAVTGELAALDGLVFALGPLLLFSLLGRDHVPLHRTTAGIFVTLVLVFSVFEILVGGVSFRGVSPFFSEPSYAGRAFIMALLILGATGTRQEVLLTLFALFFLANRSGTFLLLAAPVVVVFVIGAIRGRSVLKLGVFLASASYVVVTQRDFLYQIRGTNLILTLLSGGGTRLGDYLAIGGRRLVQTSASYFSVLTEYPLGVGPANLRNVLDIAWGLSYDVPNTAALERHWDTAKPTSWFASVFFMYGFTILPLIVASFPRPFLKTSMGIWSFWVFAWSILLVSNPLDPTPWVALWVNQMVAAGRVRDLAERPSE